MSAVKRADVVLVPCYNHGRMLAKTLEPLLTMPIIIIDDGSDKATADEIDRLCACHDNVSVCRLSQNGGKGAAMMAGFKAAKAQGYTHALQIDADGQHDARDVPAMLAASKKEPDALISGEPVYDETIPKKRLIGREITHFWVKVETLTTKKMDSMCGFRVYPIDAVMALLAKTTPGRRMDFDPEIMVRLYWEGTPIRFIPTRVIYPEDGLSHFDLVKDNVRISKMHTRLVLSSLKHWPAMIARRRRAHWSAMQERRGALGIRLLFALYGLGGRPLFKAVLLPVIGVYRLTGKAQRRASNAYLQRLAAFRQAKGLPAVKLSGFSHFYAFGEAMLDKLVAWRGDLKVGKNVVFADEQSRALLTSIDPAVRGKMVFVSHVGVIEACRALAQREGGVAINALVFHKHAPRFKAMMESVAPQSTGHLLAVDAVGLDTIDHLQSCLAKGEWVAIAADRTPVHEEPGKTRTVTVPFLGEPAPFPVGPYVLASLLAVPVLTVFAVREGDTIKVYAREFADRVVLPRARRQAALMAYARQWAEQLQAMVLKHPHAWFNFYDFWAQPNEPADSGQGSGSPERSVTK